MIKIARIAVNPYKLEEYKAILKEEMETSLRLEDGVQVLYATWDNENPNRFTILEKYESEEAYTSHCASPQLKSILNRLKKWFLVWKSRTQLQL